MKKAIFIVGSTASGKTGLAFNLAKKIPSILIGADSVHVYKKLDIISGKDLPPDFKFVDDHFMVGRTPLYLVDVIDPSKTFSVKNFVEEVSRIVDLAYRENKIPIIVGGTRFYIYALLNNIETLTISPNETLRKELSELSVEELQEKLKKINSSRFNKLNNSDLNNPRRLIRAIEVGSSSENKHSKPLFDKEEVLMIGLEAPFDEIKEKIDIRLKKRLEQGAVEEAKLLFADFEKLSDQVKSTNGYLQLFDYLSGKLTIEEAIEKWRISEYQLARDQISWVKNNQDIIKFDIRKKGFEEEVFDLIKENFSFKERSETN